MIAGRVGGGYPPFGTADSLTPRHEALVPGGIPGYTLLWRSLELTCGLLLSLFALLRHGSGPELRQHVELFKGIPLFHYLAVGYAVDVGGAKRHVSASRGMPRPPGGKPRHSPWWVPLANQHVATWYCNRGSLALVLTQSATARSLRAGR